MLGLAPRFLFKPAAIGSLGRGGMGGGGPRSLFLAAKAAALGIEIGIGIGGGLGQRNRLTNITRVRV